MNVNVIENVNMINRHGHGHGHGDGHGHRNGHENGHVHGRKIVDAGIGMLRYCFYPFFEQA
jgi:hypothetical protein